MNTSTTKVSQLEHNIEKVWENLIHPDKIVVCVPGAKLKEKVDENNYKGDIELKFGPIKSSYEGLITFVEKDKANYKMVLKGSGTDVKGKGGAEMVMNCTLKSLDDNNTELNCHIEISVSGMLAQFGSRLINDVNNQVFNQFVSNFKNQLAGKEVKNTLSAGKMMGAVIKSKIFGSKN